MSRYPANIITKSPATPTGPSTYGSAPGIWRLEDVAYWQKQGLWPNPSIIPDTYFPYVSLLLSSTSLSNASNNLFVDSSGAFNPVSRTGNTTQGSFTPYGSNWSNYFDGSGDYLSGPTNSAFDFGSGDFTVEAWVCMTALPSLNASSERVGALMAYTGGTVTANQGWEFYINATTNQLSFSSWGTANRALCSFTPVIGTWYHLAATRSGGTARLFINGVSQTLTTNTLQTNTDANANIRVGTSRGDTGYDHDFPGYISNARIVKGTAVYTADFSVPSTPLTAISGTSLLTCQSNRFIDNSSNAFTITVNGDTKVQKFGPFSPTAGTGYVYNQSDITNWSGYFNGGTDRLQVPVTSNMYLGTTYTIEAWVYYNSTSYGAREIFNEMEPFQGGFAYLGLGMNTSGQFVFDYRPATSGAVTTITGPTVTPYTWYHIAVSNNATSAKLFVNGVQVGSTTTIGDYPSAKTNTVAVGSWGSGWNDGGIPAAAWIGYISNLRVVKGTAVYTANFTPPTSPLTAISGTVLLTCQNGAFTDNSSVNNILTPVTNATVSGNSPFNTTGYWSNTFSSGNYLSLANSTPLNLSGGAYTIEMWINPVGDYGNYNTLLAKRVASSSSTAWEVYLRTSTGVLSFYNGTNYESTTTPTPGVWSHVAAVYDGTNMNLYLNGTRVLQSAITNSDVSASIYVGTYPSYDERFIGNMSNLRITKGAALYSGASFTPPTGPLTTTVSSGTVSLLTCQSSRFIDNSVNAATVTVNGSPTVQPFNPFYTSTIASNGGSMYFDGNGDYVSVAASQSTTFGSGDFTIQLWVYSGANSTSTRLAGNGAGAGWGANKWVLGTGFAGTPNKFFFSVNNTGVAVASTTTFNDSAWHHVAVTRSGSTWRLFVDGVQENTLTSSVSFDGGIAANISVGSGQISGDADWAGWICGFQMIKGTALYTSNFTRPTAPANPTAATTLLLNGMNAGIYDATTINDMETVGNAQVSTVQSKFGGSSVYFDGTGDWLDIPANPSLDFGTGDFTIEGWIYVPDRTLNSAICQFGNAATTAGFQFMVNGDAGSGGVIALRTNSGQPLTTTGTISNNTWTHVAITRASGTTRIFINGTTSGGTYNWTSSLSSGSTRRIGGDIYSHLLTGYIDDLRVTKGVARYTANFTPPTQAFPVY